MKYLIDTNIFIWFIEGDSLLPKKFEEIISDSDNEIYISIASIWEITIKKSNGNLEFKKDFFKTLNLLLTNHNFELINISIECLQYLENLPFIHKDPFDRIIYSTAKTENITFLYTDKIFDEYENYFIINS